MCIRDSPLCGVGARYLQVYVRNTKSRQRKTFLDQVARLTSLNLYRNFNQQKEYEQNDLITSEYGHPLLTSHILEENKNKQF